MERNSQQALVEQLKIELSPLIPLKKLNALEEYISDALDVMRSTLLRAQLKDFGFIDQLYYQEVPCDESMISCYEKSCTIDGITFTSDTDVYQVTLPNLVTGVMNHNIKAIADNNLTKNFLPVTFNDFINFESEYVKPGPIYTVIGSNKLFIRNLPSKGMKFISIWALLLSPKTNCGWKSSDYYPVPSEYKLKLLVKKDLLSTMPGSNQKQETDDKNKET